jgi:hypothetical protein
VKGHFHILSRINTACLECWYTLSVLNVSFCQEHRHVLLPETSLHIACTFFCRNCLLNVLTVVALYDRVCKLLWAGYLSHYSLATGWTTGRSKFDPRQKRKDFSSSLCVQTGSGAHSASCTVGTGGPFAEGKARPGRDADHSPSSSSEVENE